MSYKIYLAALLLAGFAFTATPALAQGYAGVLPAENNGSADDKGALPFMSSQMGGQQTGGNAKVTGDSAAESAQDAGGDDIGDNGSGDEQAAADMLDLDGDGEPDAPDITDVYGLNGDTTLSTDIEAEQAAGKSGYMAMIGGEDKKGPDKIDIGNDPTPENLYRAMEGGDKNDAERARLRMNRELELARAAHDKEIDAMNAARMHDNQVRAQAEINRVTAIQEEAMAKVREAQGTAMPEDYVLKDGVPAQENTDGTAEAVDSTDGDEHVDDDANAE
jgi:hypothetical protein